MVLRGENVGTAYVRILADGDGLNQSIRDQFKEQDGAFDEAGRRGSKRYREAFAEEMDKRPNRDELQGSITRALAEGDYLENFLNSKNWKQFREGLGKQFGDAGRLAGDNLETELVKGMDLGNIDLAGLRKRLAQATEQLHREEEKAEREHGDALNIDRLRTLTEAYAMNKAFDQRQRKLVEEAYFWDRQYNLKRTKAERDRVDAMKAMLTEAYNLNKAFNDRQTKMLTEAYRANAEIDRKRSFAIKKLAEDYKALGLAVDDTVEGAKGHVARTTLLNDLRDIQTRTHLAGAGAREMEDQLRRMEKALVTAHPRLSRISGDIDTFATGVGRAFGKGSRNNFLNFIGSFIGGIAGLLKIIPNAISQVDTFARGIQTAVTGALADGQSGLQATLAGVAAGLESGGAAFLAMGAAAVAAVVLIGPFVSILSLLLGIVTALAASISFGLIGAIAPLVGLILPAAAAVGVLVAAFKGLSDQQKAVLKADFKPIVASLKEIGVEARKGVLSNIGNQAQRLKGVLGGFDGIARSVGVSISHIGDYWLDALNSKGFRGFKQDMSIFLPVAVEKLGRIIGNSLGAAGGIFRALIPITSEFLGWLEKITGEFADFANSTKGQASLERFFKRAGDSAQALGHFAKGALDLIIELFDQGKGVGDDIFTQMGDAAERFTKYLEDHPDAVSKWFDNAKSLAEDIGNIVVQLGLLAGKLETVASDKAVIDTFDAIVAALQTVVWWVGFVNGAFSDLAEAFKRVKKAIEVGIHLDPPFIPLPSIAKFAGLNVRIIKTVGRIELIPPSIALPPLKKFIGFNAKIVAKVGRTVLRVPTIALPSIRKFGAVAGNIIRTVGTAHLHTPVIDLPSIRDFFSVPGKVIRAVGRIHLNTPSISLPDISGFFGLAGRIIRAVGTIHLNTPTIHLPHIPGLGGLTASGGVFEGARGTGVLRTIGEAGAEAVVPLSRDLSQVDPSVRWLSAIAQGKAIPSMASGGVVGSGKTVNVQPGAIQVITPNSDARAVASELLNRLVASGY